MTTPARRIAADPSEPTLDEVIDQRLIHCLFQPLVSLQSGNLVAMEALSRGPAGTKWESPVVMLDAATQAGRLRELDQVCRSVALQTATRSPWPAALSLFVNVEPAVLDVFSLDLLVSAHNFGIDVTIELTERDVTLDIATLLGAAERIRANGGRVALDDVGAVPASLALIPLVRPDVVKLDMSVLAAFRKGSMPDTATSVRAYAEESGATVVAEGIESSEDLAAAKALGATVGQGWFFGRPAPAPTTFGPIHPLPRVAPPAQQTRPGTPFGQISRARPTAIDTKSSLVPISRMLEQQAATVSPPPLLLATFQHTRYFDAATKKRYAELARRLPFVAVLGVGVESHPAPGVRGSSLDAEDELVAEWSIIALGAHFSVALVGQDLGDAGLDGDRRFRYVLSHDRALVVAAARSLIDRIAPD